jgi:hypothetical protein
VTEILIDPISTGTARKGHYLNRHWRGELSLPVAFWVNYVVLSVVYFVIGKIMESNNVGDSAGDTLHADLAPDHHLAMCRYLAKRR